MLNKYNIKCKVSITRPKRCFWQLHTGFVYLFNKMEQFTTSGFNLASSCSTFFSILYSKFGKCRKIKFHYKCI